MSQENRTLECLNQKLIIESGTEVVGLAGKTAYILLASTSDGIKYNQSLHEGSGLARHYAEKTLQVECGIGNKDNNHSYRLLVHHGNCDINADKGKFLTKAKQITLQAAEEIVLQAPKIRLGYEQPGATDEVLIYGSKVHVDEKGLKDGNIADLLKKSSIFKAFGGSYALSDVASAVATAYGGPVAGAAISKIGG